jgi:hypothetical protein
LRSFRMWDNGMDTNSKDETSCTTQYQEAYLKYLQNEYCAEPLHLPVIKPKRVPTNTLFASGMDSRSVQSCYDLYDLSSHNEEYRMNHNEAEMTPGRSNPAAR